MQSLFRKHGKLLFISLATGVLILNISIGLFLLQRAEQKNPPKSVTPTIAPKTTTISYNGVEGKDALGLLMASHLIEQNHAGLVIAIDGKKADAMKREFWAFYVNGKMAEVGPSEYITKSSDKVSWKIETY